MGHRYAFAVPVLPGKSEQVRTFASALAGPRNAEYADLNRRANVTAEYLHLMETPEGAFVIVYGEGEAKSGAEFLDPAAREFDRWFREQVLDVTGVDVLEVSGDPSELLVAWHAGK